MLGRRPLGTTGIEVSPLGLGTVKLGRDRGVKYPERFELPTDAEARALLDAAQGLGINLLDTAPAYGESEERLGRTVAADRDRWVIVTKAGESFDGRRSSFDFSAQAVRASVHSSLRRLRTDRLDAVLLHSDGDDERVLKSGGLGALLDLRDRGDVLAVGASTKTREGGQLAVSLCDVVMLEISVTCDAHDPAAAEAERLGVGVLAKKSLLSGRAGRGEGAPTPGECLAHAVSVPGVTSVVVGTLSAAHLRANADAVERALASAGGGAGA